MCRLYANTMRFYVRGLSIYGFSYLAGARGPVLESLCHVDTQGCLEQQTLRSIYCVPGAVLNVFCL